MAITLRSLIQLVKESNSNLMLIRFKRHISIYNAGTIIEVNAKYMTEERIEELVEVLDEPIHAIFVYRGLITADVG